MAMVKPIKEIVKQECKKRGITVAELARRTGMTPFYLYNILNITKVSRKAIFRVAEFLHRYDLLHKYEKELRSRTVAKQRKKTTPHRGGRHVV